MAISQIERGTKQASIVKRSFEDFSAAERDEIALWYSILKEWQDIRCKYKHKTEVDPKFIGKCQLEHPEIDVSIDILYSKYNA